MKAIISPSYGSYHNLQLVTDFAKPTEIPKGNILVKTHAVALAPGDVRVLSGACKEFQGPPSFPYIPGGDLCGTVVDMNNVDPSTVGFNVGDRVAARFTKGPRDALAEYAHISPKMTYKVPENLTSEDAAALASSATIALCLSQRITPNERVIIMGAGGGVGSHLCQILRIKGVKCIAAASHDPDRMLKEPLLCNYALDYNKHDVYDFQEWKRAIMTGDADNDGDDDAAAVEQFDTVIDLAGGGWLRLLEQQQKQQKQQQQQQQQQQQKKPMMLVKPANQGGRYLTLVPDSYEYEMHNMWQFLQVMLFPSLYRAIYSRTIGKPSLPAYTFAMSLDNKIDLLKETLQLASDHKLKACVDNRGPFPFTTQGAQDAFQLQQSRQVRGKVVIQTAGM
jgi:NADPH:quinone reductase and related Zn-dependent oxidoreductases